MAMRRDYALICKILEYVEREQINGPVAAPSFEGYTPTQVHNHIKLCVEAGYIEAPGAGIYDGGIRYNQIDRLTWLGHEALDDLRQRNAGNDG